MKQTNFLFCFLFLIFFLKRFDNDRFFPAYLDQFAAGENVQVAGDIAGAYWQPWKCQFVMLYLAWDRD